MRLIANKFLQIHSLLILSNTFIKRINRLKSKRKRIGKQGRTICKKLDSLIFWPDSFIKHFVNENHNKVYDDE